MIADLQLKEDMHPEVRSFVDTGRLAADLAYNPTDFGGSFMDHSALVVYYGELAGRAENQTALAKAQLDRLEAQIAKDLRLVAVAKGEKPVESRVEKDLRLDPRFEDAQRKLRDAKYIQRHIESIITALEHRRSMLLQHARNDISARQALYSRVDEG